jgi:hypothetical protein
MREGIVYPSRQKARKSLELQGFKFVGYDMLNKQIEIYHKDHCDVILVGRTVKFNYTNHV